MELLSVNLARVVWFVPARDVNPRGLNGWNTLFPALIERYKFVSYPKKEESFNPNREPGEKFIGGEFLNAQGMPIMLHFTSYDDGIVADTRSSTQDSENFLIEFSQWIVSDFGLTFRPEMIRSKGYVSELYVTSDGSLSNLNPQLQRFADRVSSLIEGHREPIPYETSGISFAATTEFKPASFIFERATDTLFPENRYYSKAPLHTDVHLTLLNELEEILKA